MENFRLGSLVFSFFAAAFFISFLTSCATTPVSKHDASLVQVASRANIEQKFLLLKPENPTAAVILFAGGDGSLQLSTQFGRPSISRMLENFLVRTRQLFADQGFIVAVIDSPSDQRTMSSIWRIGPEHAQDVHAVVQALKKDFNLPVWLVGTSMGTISVCNAAQRLGSEVDGLVLTSSITRSLEKWPIYADHPNATTDMDLDNVTVPTLIVAHKEDGCRVSPAADAGKLKGAFTKASKIEVKYFTGGKTAMSQPCYARSSHGYYGIESDVVAAIADFIKSSR